MTTNPPTSNSNKAYVDTTILTDVLLKPGTQECTDAQRALRQFAISELPTYAIKEFKRGPLKNYVWFHNKLALNNSLAKAMSALQRMSLTPKRYTTATALQAIVQGTLSLSRLNLGQLQTKYGSQANPDEFLCDQYRLDPGDRFRKAKVQPILVRPSLPQEIEDWLNDRRHERDAPCAQFKPDLSAAKGFSLEEI